MNCRWKIWMKFLDLDGKVVGYGVHPRDYSFKCSAKKRAKQLWGDNKQVEYRIGVVNPWEVTPDE